MKNYIKVAKGAYKEWMAKDPFRQSAIIAYYSIFSLPGLFVVILTLAGWFFGREAVNTQVMHQVSSALGQDTGKLMQNVILQQESQRQNTSIWGAIFGVITVILGATGVFVQFQKTLNIIWEVKADPKKSGVMQVVRVRLFSFGLIIAIAFLLMVSLLVSTVLTAFGDWLSSRFSDSMLILLKALNFVVSLGILTFLFALMLKVFPDAKIKWKDVWVGSLVTALLFILGRFALSLYFGKAHPGSVFGAAGSVILVLLWVSYSSMIVFYGAEFTRKYADIVTGGVRPPAKHAVKEDDPCKDDDRKMTEAVKSRTAT